MFMTKFFTKSTLFIFVVLLAACASTNRVNKDELAGADISNLSNQSNNTYVSGQPTQQQVAILADAGINHVISLRTEGELDWNESELVESAGMEFHSIPIGRDGLTSANAQSLESLLASLDGQPVLVHCGSGNRVGALKAITAHDGGANVDDALAEGQRWGLTGMEPTVRDLLSDN